MGGGNVDSPLANGEHVAVNLSPYVCHKEGEGHRAHTHTHMCAVFVCSVTWSDIVVGSFVVCVMSIFDY